MRERLLDLALLLGAAADRKRRLAEYRSPEEREVLFAAAVSFDSCAHLVREHAEMDPPRPPDGGPESEDFHRGWWAGARYAFAVCALVLVPAGLLFAVLKHGF